MGVNILTYNIKYYRMQSPALFKNIFKFFIFLHKFSNILPFFLENGMQGHFLE